MNLNNNNMNKLLKKISWKTRRWNLKVSLLDIFLHDGQSSWGFTLLEIVYMHRSYSLLALGFRLPNGADIRVFSIDHWDFLFLKQPLWKYYSDLDDRKMWSNNLSTFETLIYKTIDKLFK